MAMMPAVAISRIRIFHSLLTVGTGPGPYVGRGLAFSTAMVDNADAVSALVVGWPMLISSRLVERANYLLRDRDCHSARNPNRERFGLG